MTNKPTHDEPETEEFTLKIACSLVEKHVHRAHFWHSSYWTVVDLIQSLPTVETTQLGWDWSLLGLEVKSTDANVKML